MARRPAILRVPALDPVEAYIPDLCRMVARTSWLPRPDVVRAVGGAVFPTVRARKGHPRESLLLREGDGEPIGVYDDNTSPRWALLWAHGFGGMAHPSERTFAHVYETGDDLAAYTHPANLAMVPEPFAGLTDKKGPLVPYLRWHAWEVYGWKPAGFVEPVLPADYDGTIWRYFLPFADPKGFIRERVLGSERQLLVKLRPIMQRLGMV